MPPTRSGRFGHLTAADFGRAAGRAAAAKRGTEGGGAADFLQWWEDFFLGARRIFPNGARKFLQWREFFLAVVGVFFGRGAGMRFYN